MRAFLVLTIVALLALATTGENQDQQVSNMALMRENEIDDGAWDVTSASKLDGVIDHRAIKKLTEAIEPRELVVRTRRGLKRRLKKIHSKVRAKVSRVLGPKGRQIANNVIKQVAQKAGIAAG